MLVFANGGTRKRKSRKVTKGRLHKPVDVRSRGDIQKFEHLLSQGPLTLVLVYADWCGACHNFRKNTWNDIVKMPNKSMNISAVREDMFPQTSLKNAKINHYPSLLLVGNNKKAAEFKTPEGEVVNALPNNSKELLSKIVTSPLPNANAVNNIKNLNNVMNNNSMKNKNNNIRNLTNIPTNIVNNSTKINNVNALANATVQNAETMVNSAANTVINKNTNKVIEMEEEEKVSPNMNNLFEPAEPPSMTNDMNMTEKTNENSKLLVGGSIGGLYRALTSYVRSGTKAFRLRKSRKHKTHKRKQRK